MSLHPRLFFGRSFSSYFEWFWGADYFDRARRRYLPANNKFKAVLCFVLTLSTLSLFWLFNLDEFRAICFALFHALLILNDASYLLTPQLVFSLFLYFNPLQSQVIELALQSNQTLLYHLDFLVLNWVIQIHGQIAFVKLVLQGELLHQKLVVVFKSAHVALRFLFCLRRGVNFWVFERFDAVKAFEIVVVRALS